MFQAFVRLIVIQVFFSSMSFLFSFENFSVADKATEIHYGRVQLPPKPTSLPQAHDIARSSSGSNEHPKLPPAYMSVRSSSATQPTTSPTQISDLPSYWPTPSPASSSTISPYPTSCYAHLLSPDMKTASPFGLVPVKEDDSSNVNKIGGVSLTNLHRYNSDPMDGMSEGLKSFFRGLDVLDKIKDDLIKAGLLHKASSDTELLTVVNKLASPQTLAQKLAETFEVLRAVPSYNPSNPDQGAMEQLLFNLTVLAKDKYTSIQKPTEKYPFGRCHV